MNEYKVEKDRFFIKVYFSNGTIMEGNIFLSLHAAHHEGHESVKELLNQKEQFIPMAFIGGSMRLINKSHIMMVSFPPSEKKVELLPFANIYEVIIYLVNHTLLNGRVSFLLPGYSCRTRDFLNQADSFLELRTDKEIYLINKGFITYVEEKTMEKRGNTWTLKSY